MLNSIILIGRLVRDPEPRYTPSGVAVTRFTLAVDRPFKSADGEKQTDFIDVVTWRKQAENCANYIGKGSLVAVEGSLQINTYTDKEGNKRKTADVNANNVRFLDKKKEQQGDAFEPQKNDAGNISFTDDDVPF